MVWQGASIFSSKFKSVKHIFVILSVFCSAWAVAQTTIDIRDLGAIGDGNFVNTSIIQQAIDSVSALGGGTVLITNGTYKSSTVVFKSKVTLRITTGDTLLAVSNNSDYPEIPYNARSWSDTYTQRSLIFAEDADSIRITGGGIISGNGLNVAYLQVSKNFRPFGVRMHHCTNVTIDSIQLISAPQWMVHLMDCEGVYMHHINIYNHGLGSNDGINVDACRNVLIEDCIVDSNDDPIVVKSHSEKVCSNVLVRRCEVATFERGIKVGNESLGPFINIRFEDILIRKSGFFISLPAQTAIYLSIADGGSADSISFERITVTTAYDTPIFVRLCNRGLKYDSQAPPPPVNYLRNVWLKDITAIAASNIPSSITGIPGFPVENIYLDNITIQAPGNGPVGNTTQPELETLRPENDIWGNTLPAYGLYVRHVEGLVLDSFCVNLDAADPRPMLYFEDTLNVTGGECMRLTSAVKEAPINAALKVYPNPAATTLQVVGLPANELLHITVTDQLGRIFMQHWFTHPSNQAQINIAELPAGIYYLQVQGAQTLHGARFVRE